jgi:hypothetical protein
MSDRTIRCDLCGSGRVHQTGDPICIERAKRKVRDLASAQANAKEAKKKINEAMSLMPGSNSNTYRPVKHSSPTEKRPCPINNGIIFGGVTLGDDNSNSGNNNNNRKEIGAKKFGDILSVKPMLQACGNDVKDIASSGQRNGKHDGIGNRVQNHGKKKWWNPWKNSASRDLIQVSRATQVTPSRGMLNASVQTSIRSPALSSGSITQKFPGSLTPTLGKMVKNSQQALGIGSPKSDKYSTRYSSFYASNSFDLSRGNEWSPLRRGASSQTSRPHIRNISFMETGGIAGNSSKPSTSTSLRSSQLPVQPFHRDYGRNSINNLSSRDHDSMIFDLLLG